MEENHGGAGEKTSELSAVEPPASGWILPPLRQIQCRTIHNLYYRLYQNFVNVISFIAYDSLKNMQIIRF